MSDKIVKFITTFGFIGYLPLAPGSMASVAGGLIAIYLSHSLLIYFAVWLILLFVILKENGALTLLPPIFYQSFFFVIMAFMVVTVFLTVISGVSYFWNNREIVLFPSHR